MTHQVVAITWTLPPIVLPRSIQVSRSMAELAARGWEAHVITAPLDANNPAVPHDERLAALYAGSYTQTVVEHREERNPSSVGRRFIRYHEAQRPETFNDENWILRAARRARWIMRRREAVFVTFAQPWINHLVGLRVKRFCPFKPWVAHFSDPWVDSPYYDAADPCQAARMALWRKQEAAVIRTAEAVVFTTAETRDLVMGKYPADWRRKAHVTPHGFDRRTMRAAMMGAVGSKATPRPFRMLYTGNIYEGQREPQPLFDALREINAERPLASRAQFVFYGNSPEATARAARERGLEEVVSLHGPVGYLDSIGLIAEADALLLLDASADINVFLPSKIVDYLMVGKPILGLTPPVGASAEVLRRTGNLAVDPRDRAAIKAAVKGLLSAHERGERECKPETEAVEAYDIRRTTDSFEAALLAAMARRRLG